MSFDGYGGGRGRSTLLLSVAGATTARLFAPAPHILNCI